MIIWVLYFIIISFINKTNCIFVLNNISGIDEGRDSDFNLFTKYNSSHLLGILDNGIYLITPFKAEKKNFMDLPSQISNMTKIKYLGNELFALICTDNYLIEIYNINGKSIKNITNYLNCKSFKDNKYGLEYENGIFYIIFLEQQTYNLNLVYLTVENNNDNKLSNITK